MPLIEIPGEEWGSQPQYQVRPSQKALDLGLTSLHYAGVQVYPVQSSLSFVNGAGLSPGLKGVSVELDGTNDYAVNSAAFPLHNNYSFTVLTRFRSDFASSSGTRRGLWHFTNTVGSADDRIRLIWLNATSGFYLDTRSGFAFSYKPTINVGEIHTIGYSRNGNTGVANNPFFWDGEQVTSTAAADGANAGAPTAALLYSGFDTENAAWVWDGSIEYIATFNKALSAKVVRDITNNPYGELLEPETDYINFPSAGGSTTITLTDTASASDTIASISVALGLSDAGSGNDALPGTSAALALTDSGSGLDALSLSALLSVSDLASSADSIAIAVSLALAETGTGNDAISVITDIIVSLADSASGADSISAVSVSTALTDSANGLDALLIQAVLALSDTCSGADLISVITETLIAISDSGVGTDGMAVAVSVPITDAANGLDFTAISALVSMVESATGADVVVRFDTAVKLAYLVFSFAQRSMLFSFAQRSMVFTLN